MSGRVLLLDVMGTLVYDPFYVEVPRFFGLELAELHDAGTAGLLVAWPVEQEQEQCGLVDTLGEPLRCFPGQLVRPVHVLEHDQARLGTSQRVEEGSHGNHVVEPNGLAVELPERAVGNPRTQDLREVVLIDRPEREPLGFLPDSIEHLRLGCSLGQPQAATNGR